MLRENVHVASRQGVVPGGSSEGVSETIDSMTSILEILIGAYWSKEELFYHYYI
jgi:hypothetical protein